ncbi:MAG: hypothetical protein LAT54_08310 [Cryomorphaceae bacterium]|nr:hypothetical protein [Cryomorphaceae bacterium]
MKYWAIIFLPLFSVFGQSETKLYQTTVEAGFLAGGKASHRTIVFRSGGELNGIFSKAYYKRLQLGLGMGAIALEDEVFVPIFFNARLKLTQKASGTFMAFRTGYAFGANPSATSIENSSYRGGWHARSTFGYQSRLSESLDLQFGFNISHQQGILDRRFISSQINQRERLRFFLFSLHIGCVFL